MAGAMVKVVDPDKESTFLVVKVKACAIGLPRGVESGRMVMVKYPRLYTSTNM